MTQADKELQRCLDVLGIEKAVLLDKENDAIRKEYLPVICYYLKRQFNFSHRYLGDAVGLPDGSRYWFQKGEVDCGYFQKSKDLYNLLILKLHP
jgi:hypothetical protein